MSQWRPKTNVHFDQRSLADLTRSLRMRGEASRQVALDPTWASDVPQEVGLQLTYKCNLRCQHCYQWNEQGFFRSYGEAQQLGELPLEVIAAVIDETHSARSKLYLWGGEPLMHSRFPEISRLLQRSPRLVNLCTNGLLLDRHLDNLLPLGEGLVLLVSLDGLEHQHDALRGRGTFRRITEQIRHVLQLRAAGTFTGELSLSCMVSDDTVGHLYEVALQAEALGVNSLYFQFPWYVNPQTAAAMDALYAAHFAAALPVAGARGSWHSYAYRLSAERLPALREDLARVASRSWDIRVRGQPELADEDLDEFIAGTALPAQGKRVCLAIANRMEVHADASISACKFFPEFSIGNLREESVRALWHGERFRAVRALLREVGLMPICSKCNLLYQNGS